MKKVTVHHAAFFQTQSGKWF